MGKENESFAMEMLRTKKIELIFKNIIIILLILVIGFLAGYIVYDKNTSAYEETEEIATSDEGNACIGDSCNNGVINNGDSD